MSKEKIVVDASIVMGSLLDDEIDDRDFLKYLRLANKKNVEIVAPSLLRLEIVNSLSWAVKRKRCDWNTAQKQLNIFLKMPISYIDDMGDLEVLMDYSQRFGLTSYDSCYLKLSLEESSKLLSNDELLINVYKKLKK